jgi:hypothetical protein
MMIAICIVPQGKRYMINVIAVPMKAKYSSGFKRIQELISLSKSSVVQKIAY